MKITDQQVEDIRAGRENLPGHVTQRDNDLYRSPADLAKIDPSSVRRLYRFAEPYPDGTYKLGSGYKPGEPIGHQVINTVRGLCDEVDRLRALCEEMYEDIDNEGLRSREWLGLAIEGKGPYYDD